MGDVGHVTGGGIPPGPCQLSPPPVLSMDVPPGGIAPGGNRSGSRNSRDAARLAIAWDSWGVWRCVLLARAVLGVKAAQYARAAAAVDALAVWSTDAALRRS